MFVFEFVFHPGYRDEAFIWKNFHPGYRDLGRKNRDLGNRDGPPSHMNTSNFLQRKQESSEIPVTGLSRSTGII